MDRFPSAARAPPIGRQGEEVMDLSSGGGGRTPKATSPKSPQSTKPVRPVAAAPPPPDGVPLAKPLAKPLVPLSRNTSSGTLNPSPPQGPQGPQGLRSTSGSRQRAPPPRGGTWNLTRDRERPVPKFTPVLETTMDPHSPISEEGSPDSWSPKSPHSVGRWGRWSMTILPSILFFM